MKIFPTTNIEWFYQDFGNNILILLDGTEDEIILNHNGAFNYGLTNTDPEFITGNHCAAQFWTTKDKVFQFFRTIFILKASDETLENSKLYNHSSKQTRINPFWESAKQWAKERTEEFLNNNKKVVVNYYERKKEGYVEPYSTSSDKAEKPDSDFKSQVLEYSFKDRT